MKNFRNRPGRFVLALAVAVAAIVALPAGQRAAEANIVETAAGAGQFETLLAAAEAAGLADVLATGGPFTVFAPTDEAFAKLPAGTVETLLKPENKDRLAAILKYHVVAGSVTADRVVGMDAVDTLNGGKPAISMRDGSAFIDSARIVKTDIRASNGVIHVIDAVILPAE